MGTAVAFRTKENPPSDSLPKSPQDEEPLTPPPQATLEVVASSSVSTHLPCHPALGYLLITSWLGNRCHL